MKRKFKIIGCTLIALFVVIGITAYGLDALISLVSAGGAIFAAAPVVGPGTAVDGTLTGERYCFAHT